LRAPAIHEEAGGVAGGLDLLGAIVAHVILVSSIVTFVARILFDTRPGHWIGTPLLLMALPLIYLLIRAPGEHRPALYYVQVGLMLGWIVLIFFLDYAYGVDWRSTQWAVVPVVVVYFAGLGGMIGVASRAGTRWAISAVVLFFVAGGLAFIQRAVTGL
jgi:hypothetical protein